LGFDIDYNIGLIQFTEKCCNQTFVAKVSMCLPVSGPGEETEFDAVHRILSGIPMPTRENIRSDNFNNSYEYLLQGYMQIVAENLVMGSNTVITQFLEKPDTEWVRK
jgi:hypothetical protein